MSFLVYCGYFVRGNHYEASLHYGHSLYDIILIICFFLCLQMIIFLQTVYFWRDILFWKYTPKLLSDKNWRLTRKRACVRELTGLTSYAVFRVTFAPLRRTRRTRLEYGVIYYFYAALRLRDRT